MLRFFSYTHGQDSRTLYKIKLYVKIFPPEVIRKSLGYIQKMSCQRSMSQIKDAIPKGYVPKK
jgi:hypothetical protein